MKIIIFIMFFISNLAHSKEIKPIDFIQNIINECKPALIKENNFFLEETMEKYIDFNEIATWIAGKNIWKDSSINKKECFINELKKLMLKTYSKTIYYYVDADVEFITPKSKKIDENTHNSRIQISSIMKKNNKNVTIMYRLIKNNDSWLVFDVIIEGISILKSLKTQYSEIIRLQGLDEAIKKIKIANEL
ncbi:MAG TPA: Tgt2/MlaC family protein [Candidatus Azoamicus sp.]